MELVQTEGENGEVTRTIELRGVEPVEYDDEAIGGEDNDESDYEDGEKKRRWSKSMSMGVNMNTVPGWRGTMKLLGMKEERKEEGYTEGAPLKKSISTGGFTGS